MHKIFLIGVLTESFAMISVTIELMAAVRNPFKSKKRKNEIKLQSHLRLDELLNQVGFQKKEISWLVPIVNGNRVSRDYLLKDKDVVFITLPIGGGQ
jgi:sulfur carrier protein ThiS